MNGGGRMHCISHINHPRLPHRLAPQHVYMILCKAKEAFGQIQFKNVPLDRPPIGDCFFELKGLEVDVNAVPIAGSPQDGYDWRGPVKRSAVPITGPVPTNLEVTQFFGGVWEVDPALMVVRVEYRVLVPNSRVYLVHYLLLDGNGTTVVPPDLQIPPAGTVNPANIFSGPPPTMQAGSMAPERSMTASEAPRPVVMSLPPVVPKTIKVPAPPQPHPSKKPQSKPATGAQHEDGAAASFLALDDDSVTRIDTAYSRYKFIGSVLEGLFSPQDRENITTAERPNEDELAELLEMQIELVKSELDRSQALTAELLRREQDRRVKLNQLFNTALETEPEAALSRWEVTTGYSLDELRLA